MKQQMKKPNARSHMTTMRYFQDHLAMRRSARQYGIAPDDHVAFAEWVIARRSGVVAGAWRRMRASALFGLDLEGAETARLAERMLRSEGSAGAAPVSRGPARISTPDREHQLLLFRALAARAKAGSRIAGVTAHWLRAGRAVGLRPCQWEHASIVAADEAGGPYLMVRAVPQRQGRRSGSAQRRIDLSGLKRAQRTAVLRFVEAVEEAGDKFDLLQSSCSQLLSRVCAELWSNPRRSVTLDGYRRRPD